MAETKPSEATPIKKPAMEKVSNEKNAPSWLGSKMTQYHIYPSDAKEAALWGLAGCVALAGYQLGMKVVKRNINPCAELKVRTTSLNMDPIIRDSFIQLQEYREISPRLFKQAVKNVDHMLFLESALLSNQVVPNRNDKAIAWSYFSIAVNRLNEYQQMVKHILGSEQAFACHIYVQKIYEQLQIHFLNILTKCQIVRPEDMIRRAKEEVAHAMNMYKKGQKYRPSYYQLEKLAKRKRKAQEKENNEKKKKSEKDKANGDAKVDKHNKVEKSEKLEEKNQVKDDDSSDNE